MSVATGTVSQACVLCRTQVGGFRVRTKCVVCDAVLCSKSRPGQSKSCHDMFHDTLFARNGVLKVMPKRATLRAKEAARSQRSEKQQRVTAAILAARASPSPSPASSLPPPPLSSHGDGASGLAASISIMPSFGSAASSRNEAGGGSGSGSGSSSGGATPGRRDNDRGGDSCRSGASPPSRRDQHRSSRVAAASVATSVASGGGRGAKRCLRLPQPRSACGVFKRPRINKGKGKGKGSRG